MSIVALPGTAVSPSPTQRHRLARDVTLRERAIPGPNALSMRPALHAVHRQAGTAATRTSRIGAATTTTMVLQYLAAGDALKGHYRSTFHSCGLYQKEISRRHRSRPNIHMTARSYPSSSYRTFEFAAGRRPAQRPAGPAVTSTNHLDTSMRLWECGFRISGATNLRGCVQTDADVHQTSRLSGTTLRQ
jgi:hypothetical protein